MTIQWVWQGAKMILENAEEKSCSTMFEHTIILICLQHFAIRLDELHTSFYNNISHWQPDNNERKSL